MNKFIFTLAAFLLTITNICHAQVTADRAIKSVKSYGFIDLEGAKLSAIIVEYNRFVHRRWVSKATYDITNYVIEQEKQHGFNNIIEQDKDAVKGNEGHIVRVYVNSKPQTSFSGGTRKGRFVVIEVNTAYILKGSNLAYTSSMLAGVKQIRRVGTIRPGRKMHANYTISEKTDRRGQTHTIYNTEKDKIILPQFASDRGWAFHEIGKNAFRATHCYSEYTGKYYDFELPYAIYLPSKEVMEANKGHISLNIHMEHAGGLDTDPMSGVTSSRAAVKLADKRLQHRNPAIIVVPQVEENRRSTDDMMASSEVNTAVWQLIDSLLHHYKGYIDENRIYGTGQSMGGMLLLNMAAQRDNFFAALAVVGAQWGNNYNKAFQHNNASARTPQNDPISFGGADQTACKEFENWYYMVSDDNILVHTCVDDPLAKGLWTALKDYYQAAGTELAFAQWDPYLPKAEQEANDKSLVARTASAPGYGIAWGAFTRSNHMSTWKYAYNLDTPFEWLFAQNRQTAINRGKLQQLKAPWLGRDGNGKIKKGSGTAGLNSAQFTPSGASKVFVEGWKVSSVETTKSQQESAT